MGVAQWGRQMVRGVQRAVPGGGRGVTVLAYHLVDGGTDSPVDITSDHLRADLAWLTENARLVPLMDADPWGAADQVVLTFDDAYANFYEVAWPLLKEFDAPATLYVPVGFVEGGPCPIRGTSLKACSWEQLAEMAADGLDIGSHTVSHPDLRAMTDGMALRREIADSRALLEDGTGTPCRSFCYPRALWAYGADLAVQTVYERAVVGGGRRWTPGIEAHRIPRTSIRRDMDRGTVPRIVRQRVWLEEAFSDAVRQRLA